MADRRKDRRLGLQKMFDDYVERLQADFTTGAEQSAQGLGDIVERGNVLTGIPRLALGGLGWMGSPVSAAVSPVLGPLLAPVAEATDSYVGQPVERLTGYPADLTNEIFLSTAIPFAGAKVGKITSPYLSRLADAAETGANRAGYTFRPPEGTFFSGGGPVKLADDEGLIAYHGSPHSFDKFSMDKIGTGEGAQAYGHGLYFAEAEDVAKTYRDMLSDQPQALPAIGWQQRMDWTDTQDAAYGLADKALEELQIDIAQGGSTRPDWSRVKDKVRQLAPSGEENEILRELDTMADKYGWKEFVNKNPGSMYQVRLNVKPDELLDWDKPLSEQPHILKALNSDAMEPTFGRLPWDKSKISGPDANTYSSGGQFIKANDHKDQVKFIENMRDAGVKGIRYLDQGSRNAGGWHITPPDQTVSGKWMVKSSDYNSKGMHFDTEDEAKAALSGKVAGQTYNYVIFDDKLITILKKYGIPMTAGAGGAMMVSGEAMPPELAAQMGGGT